MNTKESIKKKRKSAQEDLQLIEQFYVTLLATFQQVKVNNPQASPEIMQRIEELLGVTSWQNAYEIERLLIEVFDEKSLDVELERRMVEAKLIFSDDLYKHYDKEKTENLSSHEDKRALLNRLVNDLQWHYAVKETRRWYSRTASKRTGAAFILSIALFGLMICIGELFNLQHDFYYIVVAMGAGLVGASFSMIVSLKNRLSTSSFDELKGLHRRGYVGTRAIIGIGAALILYYVLQAEVLTGSVFPSFTPPEVKEHKTNQIISDFIIFEIPDSTIIKDKLKRQSDVFVRAAIDLLSDVDGGKDSLVVEAKAYLDEATNLPEEKLEEFANDLTNKLWSLAGFTPFLDFRNLALLIFWCFLAGFSEKFVPNLLAKAEEKAAVK